MAEIPADLEQQLAKLFQACYGRVLEEARVSYVMAAEDATTVLVELFWGGGGRLAIGTTGLTRMESSVRPAVGPRCVLCGRAEGRLDPAGVCAACRLGPVPPPEE
jgi:hypothetical protein